jgi:hypothetical protein
MDKKLDGLSLRKICALVGIKESPQVAKFHLSTLIVSGFIKVNSKNEMKVTKDGLIMIEFMKNNPSLFKKIELLYRRC